MGVSFYQWPKHRVKSSTEQAKGAGEYKQEWAIEQINEDVVTRVAIVLRYQEGQKEHSASGK